MLASTSADTFLDEALDALESGRDCREAILDALPVPAYITDAEGLVTHWNRACIEFAGREPRRGEDRWCVTWRIHTTADDYLPHESCPMAVAIREQRPVRGEVAIAMRPDGTRKAFIPYPTPMFDRDGALTGAVNLLIDVTDRQAGALAEQAARCRRLAAAICDRQASDMLRAMAHGYERNAKALRMATPA